ncbi:isocitrate lyase/PEP mutase family protein [Brevibacterium spongiae]|uniref:Isocitrate lyase/phosphoenolpyruvate mutase family protein n=1 Tax=Brevibacterium spongiae TaxID=2909672 RepID=A0ABY5SQK6_9MICO|nr:isocitrate lyase/phosphoenolpyruvate mutase family protein [Brevibacterium spongiae]UVI36840.1 isocitrate lyase/phosphoenolpyruvate mutase family protein [Brevibacterium spongiae]
MSTPIDTASTFRGLHIPGDPFILPCAWDVASAQLFAEAGHRAVGTTSLGIAAAIGAADEDREALTATANLVAALRRALPEQPLTCDFEDGYGDSPESVVAAVREAFAADPADPADPVPTTGGLIIDGINIQDSRHGRMSETAVLAAKVSAVKEAFPDLFVNARIDTFWLGQDNLGEVLCRIDAYTDAGADGIFVPGDLDLATIETITARSRVPVNVLASPRYSRTMLAEAGVARISTGSLLYRAAMSEALRSLAVLADDRPAETENVRSYRSFTELN